MPAALRPVSGAVDGLTARYRVLGRVARGAFDEQVASARRGRHLHPDRRQARRRGVRHHAGGRGAVEIRRGRTGGGAGDERHLCLPAAGPDALRPGDPRDLLAAGVRSGSPALRSAIAAMTAQVQAQLTAGLRPPAGAVGALATLPATSSRGGAAPGGSGGGQYEVLPVTRGGVAALPAPGRGAAVPIAGAAALPAPAGLGRAAPEVTTRAGIPVAAPPVATRLALPPPAVGGRARGPRRCAACRHPVGSSAPCSGRPLHPPLRRLSPPGWPFRPRSRRSSGRWSGCPPDRRCAVCRHPVGSSTPCSRRSSGYASDRRCAAVASPRGRLLSWGPPLPSRLPPDPCCAMPAPVS